MEILNALEIGFENEANEAIAIQMKSYMKNHFQFYGIKSPIRKKIVASAWNSNKISNEEQLTNFMNESWKKDEREWQYAAMDIMGKCKRLFSINTIELTERLIKSKSWWDTVDWLSSHAVGSCFKSYPEIKMANIRRWMDSEDIWLQRSCLIFQLKYREETDFELMKDIIIELSDSKEFFIRKGAGWALRQYSKFRPDLVREFIELHPELSPLTKREGLKYC